MKYCLPGLIDDLDKMWYKTSILNMLRLWK
jgi:hypothetical protein